uniref:LRRCT domain-containing protein n=1 Tax=Neolamprologus brichardi TaxID=32507 RepID=A0A3Q4IG39_NEOBR
MKIFHIPVIPFVFLLILPDGIFSSECPVGCSCSSGSIFCFQRRSSTMPKGVDPFTKSLYLFSNGIEGLTAEDFNGLQNLNMLDLSQNKLTHLPNQVFEPLISLRNLDLSSNQITHISEELLKETPGLIHLSLFSQLFPHLRKLTLAQNPFNCLCNLAWFPRWLRTQSITLEKTEETRCHFPPINAGKVLERLDHRDFGCPTTTTVTTSTVKTTTTQPALVTTFPTTTKVIPAPRASDNPTEKEGDSPDPPCLLAKKLMPLLFYLALRLCYVCLSCFFFLYISVSIFFFFKLCNIVTVNSPQHPPPHLL